MCFVQILIYSYIYIDSTKAVSKFVGIGGILPYVEAIKSNKFKKIYKPNERWRGSHMSNSSHGERVVPASQCQSDRHSLKKKKNLAIGFRY